MKRFWFLPTGAPDVKLEVKRYEALLTLPALLLQIAGWTMQGQKDKVEAAGED